METEDDLFCVNCREPEEMPLEGLCEDCCFEFHSRLEDLEVEINEMLSDGHS